jgi:hypothetical protein
MIVLRISALFALLLPVSFLTMVFTTGDESDFINFSFSAGFLGLEVTAIAILVFAWKRRSDRRPSWPDLSTTIAAALSVPVPWLTFRLAFQSLDGPDKHWVGMLIFVPAVYAAVRLLMAPGKRDAYLSNVDRTPSKCHSVADVVRRHALDRGHGLEGSGR